MHSKTAWFIFISAFYYNCWLTLIVVYHLSGWAKITGAAVALWILTNILSSLRINSRYSL